MRTVFLLALLLLTALLPTAVVAEVERLGWRDSGYDLAAGYRYTITLRSGCIWTGACAAAGFDATIVKAELRGSHLKVWINGQLSFDQGVDSESATITIVVDHDGSGTVELSGYGRLGGFSIDHRYRIMVFTETVSTWPQSFTSEVAISRSRLPRPQPPPGQPPGYYVPYPHPGDDYHGEGGGSDIAAAIGSAAAAGIAAVILVLGILLVLLIIAKLGGVKGFARRVWGSWLGGGALQR